MGLKPPTKAAIDLLMKGAICFSRMSATGVHIDTAYLDKAITDVTKQVAEMEHDIRNHKIIDLWKKHYGKDMKLNSRTQLGNLIFNVLGHKRNPFLEKKNNEVAFKHVKEPFVGPDGPYFGIAKLKKALSKELIGLRREVTDGYVHPSFGLLAESYRSSCNTPNMQNVARRNKKIAEIVRSAIIPRKGHVLLEADYSAQEVRVAACYCKDPKLIEYVTGGGDQHYDAAKDIYMLTDEEIGGIGKGQPGRDVRDIAKNKYVFPQNYGSYYLKCTPDLWDMIAEVNLRTAQGVPMYEHLRSKSIKRMGACDSEKDPVRGTFEYHIKEVEKVYWERLAVYDQWRTDWWQLYQNQGGINTLTGFCMAGKFRRNQILCDPIQGSAFHCLLWSLIEMQEYMIRKKMSSKLILQVHDSALFDAHKREVDDIREVFERIAVKKVAEHYKWLCVPLNVEFEVAERNWYSKVSIKEYMAA